MEALFLQFDANGSRPNKIAKICADILAEIEELVNDLLILEKNF
jgi:hypothetical protein